MDSRAHIFPYINTSDIGICGTINGILWSTVCHSLFIIDVFFLSMQKIMVCSFNLWCPRFSEVGIRMYWWTRYGGPYIGAVAITHIQLSVNFNYSIWGYHRLWSKIKGIKCLGRRRKEKRDDGAAYSLVEWVRLYYSLNVVWEIATSFHLLEVKMQFIFKECSICISALEPEIQVNQRPYRKYRIVWTQCIYWLWLETIN